MTVFVVRGGKLLTQRAARSLDPGTTKPVSRKRSVKARGAQVRARPAGEAAAFTPIGLNLPLTIRIAHVYTGRYPAKSFFGGARQDMMLTSAIKSYSVFSEAPRAIQYFETKVSARSGLSAPAATNQGTSLIYYTPAVTDASLTLTLDLMFDAFPDALLDKLGGGLQTLGGLPIFTPLAGYLMIGSQIARLAGDIGRQLFEGQPEFTRTETIDFDLPGHEAAEAAFRILAAPSFDLSGLDFKPRKGLVYQSDPTRAYDGDEPYIVLGLDGRTNTKLENFEPTLASAELLQRVIGSSRKEEAAIDLFVEAARLANDAKYRSEADRLQREIDGLRKGGGKAEDIQTLAQQRSSYIKNIRSDLLKPPSEAEPVVRDDHDAAGDQPVSGAARSRARGGARVRTPVASAASIRATAANTWRVAAALLRLRDQVNAAWPNRSKASDGTIGDAAHASRQSDHNPWVVDNGVGVVTALDITHDPANGCDAGAIVAALIAGGDTRIKYIIYNAQITSSYKVGTVAAWVSRPYTGPNKHTKHLHLSVGSEPEKFDDAADWSL